MRWSGSVKAVLAWLVRRRIDQMPSTGLRSGVVGRQVVGGDPVVCVDERAHAAVLVDVEVVPDEDNRFAELLVGGEQEVAVLGPGEALAAAALVIGMPFGPVDQAGAFSGFVAAQGRDGEAALGTAADPDDRSGSAFGPGS